MFKNQVMPLMTRHHERYLHSNANNQDIVAQHEAANADDTALLPGKVEHEIPIQKRKFFSFWIGGADKSQVSDLICTLT